MQPPADYKNAGAMMLISGVFNVLTSIGIIIGLALSLVGLCVAPIWVLTLAGGIMEIVVGANAMQGRPGRLGLSTAVIGLISAVCCGNVLGIILEILAMVNLGKPEVVGWLANPARPELPPTHGHHPPIGGPAPSAGPPSIGGPAPSAGPPAPRPGPADFPPSPTRRAGPSVSWTGDLPLEQKRR
jgi:hypothetical protein